MVAVISDHQRYLWAPDGPATFLADAMGTRQALAAKLEERGVYTLAELARLSEQDLLAISGIGPVGVRWLRRSLACAGLSLAT
jgi:predicted flap endonuclease-1-like 5' DNA nuclease